MSSSVEQGGYFLFTLDTELAWGHFDIFRPGLFSTDGKRERSAILRLLDMLDEFDLVATWALVGHLFYEKCEECQVCPILDWQEKYEGFLQIYRNDSPLWYGADIIKTLLERADRHEIAFHGYTHRLFDPDTLSKQEARMEIDEWLRVSSRWNMRPPTAAIFPRNHEGYIPLFGEYGFLCYRGDELLPLDYYSLPFWGKLLNRIDLVTQLRTPQVYSLPVPEHGMVNLPASRGLFRVHSGFKWLLQRLNLEYLPAMSLIRGVEKAVREKKVMHLYAHPYEFREESDFVKLRNVFKSVAQKVQSGELLSVSMSGLARRILGVDSQSKAASVC